MKIAAKRIVTRSSTFPEIPPGLPQIPRRYSRHSPAPTGVLVPEHDPSAVVFTKAAREEVGRILQSWRPRPTQDQLEAIVSGLIEPILVAKFALTEGSRLEVVGLRRLYERIAARSKGLRRDLDALRPVKGQIALDDALRACGARSAREQARDLAVLERVVEKLRPGRQVMGHPKAGSTRTRYLAARIADLLHKHNIRTSPLPGSIYERIVRCLWECVEDSAAPKNLTRFLRSVLS